MASQGIRGTRIIAARRSQSPLPTVYTLSIPDGNSPATAVARDAFCRPDSGSNAVALEVGANRADGPPGLSAGPAPSRLPLETPDRRERSVLACRSRSVALTTFGVRPH